jgi:phosphoserine phosphatase
MARKPVIAILYDFDKTLSTKDMQEYSFIPNLGMSAEEFWSETGRLAERERLDRVLAYMYMMIRESKRHEQPIRREDFVKLGRDLKYFPGVETWFGRISEIGRAHGAEVEHYIISSGIREIIEGSSVFRHFREVFACEFHYDENGVADWPKAVVNYTTKTQHLFRVNKGILDVTKDDELNRYTPEGARRVPFRNMIYIGDGLTDVPCMKLVKVNGGKSIAVYPKGDARAADRVRELLAEDRVDFILDADYRKGRELERTVRDVIARMAMDDRLIRLHERQLEEDTL